MKLFNIFKSKKLKVGSEFKYKNTDMICKVIEITTMQNTTIIMYNCVFTDEKTVEWHNNNCRRNEYSFAHGSVAYDEAIKNLLN
jgi:hypothetical protein